MKRIWIALTLVALWSCDKDRHDWVKLHLNGDVKELSEAIYTADVQTSEAKKGKLQKIEKTYFDKDGRVARQVVMDEADTVSKTTFVYAADGSLSEKLMNDGFDQLMMHIYYTYDEKGRQTEARVEKDGETVHVEKTEYNDDNNIETTISYDGSGDYLKKEERKMGKNGLPKEVEIFDEKRELVNCRREEYDQAGNLVGFTVLAVDEQTPVIEVRRTYDKMGNMLKQEAVDLQGQEAFETEEYRYVFDKKKNWEKCVHYVGNQAQYFTEREIVYY